MKKDYFTESTYWVDVDEETGKKFWRGGGEGDMDETQFDIGEPLILDPEAFEEGFKVEGYSYLEVDETGNPV